MQLRDQTFFISGGASGLGAACAQRFAAAGAHVVLADVNAATGEQLASQIGANARFVRTDVTDEASVQAAVDVGVNTFGGLQARSTAPVLAWPNACSDRRGRIHWPASSVS